MAVFQIADGNTLVAMTMKNKASLSIDGVAYLPATDISLAGTLSGGTSGCGKVVANSIVTKSGAQLKLQQSTAACNGLGVRQYSDPGTTTTVARLLR